ncbi:MFS monocarboxylate transporter [Rhodotorula toruloides]|uniref:MFS monocarboxylate transporter n=1 Tax=Rhodotorula toruloides TaxID=5286 RepID=A0A511KPZ0_RHOTO|nr:MFS monocarboxylate transporter [Rhodotorula toruloides]
MTTPQTAAPTDDHGNRTSPTASTFSTETAEAIATLPEDSSAYDDAKSKATSVKSAARSNSSKLVELEDEETASVRSEAWAKSPTTSTAPILAVTSADDELHKTPTRGVTPEPVLQRSQVDEVEELEKPLPVLPATKVSSSYDEESLISSKDKSEVAIDMSKTSSTYPPIKAELPTSTPIPHDEVVAIAPPDGGLRAWLNVLGGFLILFASFGLVTAYGVFQAYYKQAFLRDHSESAISWIGSVQLCLFFVMALVAGPLFDKGRFRFLIGFGSGLWILSIFLIPQATKYWHTMLIQGVLGGLAVGILFLPALSIQSHWFERRRALAIGLVASGTSIGGIVFPIMLNKLIVNPNVGFANAVRAAGYLVAALLVIANLIMAPHPARALAKKPPHPPLKHIFNPTYTFFVIGAAILGFGCWMPNFYIQVYFKVHGASANATYYSLAMFNAGSFLGRTLPNLVADSQIMTSQPALISFAILYGFFSGGFISLVSPLIVSISDHLGEIGLRQGIAFLCMAASALGGNPIAGRLLTTHHGDFLYPIVFAATMLLAGTAITAIGLALQMKKKGSWRV